MKNILFICESYKHKASSNGICVEKVACSLSKGGYGVSVVTLYNDVNQKRTSVSTELKPLIE